MTDFLSGGNDWGIKKSSSSSLTGQQLLGKLNAQKQKPSQSFVDRIKNAGESGLHGVTWSFDKLLRPMYGTEQYIDTALIKRQGLGAGLHAAKEGFWNDKAITGSTLLKDAGLLRGHGILRGLAGLGIDIAADPLTYLSGGTSVLLKNAEHADLVHAGELARNFDVAPRTPKEMSKLLQDAASTLSKGGSDYHARSALAQKQLEAIQATKHGKQLSDPLRAQLNALKGAATAEFKANEKFLPQFSARIPFTQSKLPLTVTQREGKQLVPALPKLQNVVNRGGTIGKAAEKWQQAFIQPAGETPVTHALSITHKHQQEQFTEQMFNEIAPHFHGFETMSAESKRSALHPFEMPDKGVKAVVPTKNGGFALNEGYISKLLHQGRVTQQQVDYVRATFKATQHLFKREGEFGIKYTRGHYSQSGKLYFPHKLSVDEYGNPAQARKNLHTEAGFQKGRGRQISLKMLHNKGYKDIETDPEKLLVGRIRQSAVKQADMATLQSVGKSLGVPSVLVNSKKLAEIRSQINKLHPQIGERQRQQELSLVQAHNAEQAFLTKHENDYAKQFENLSAKARSIKFGRKSQTKKARLVQVERKISALHENHAKEVQLIEKSQFKPLNETTSAFVQQGKEHTKALKELKKEMNALKGQERKIIEGKKNPHFDESTHTTTKLTDEHGHPIALPREVAGAIDRYSSFISEPDKAVKEFGQVYRKALAAWKLAVTSVNPGYRVRNTISDIWAMYLAGMPLRAIPAYATKAQRLMRAAKNGDPKAMGMIVDAYHQGLLSGLYKGDVNMAAQYLRNLGKSKTALIKQGRYLHASTKLAQDFNAHVENWGRLTHYLWRRERLGESTAQAVEKIKQAHFDYEDLTPFEQRKMKLVAPFYTWLRKNVPYQLKSFASSPGQMAAYPKFAAESEQAAGGDKGNIIPGYIPDSFGFQIPFGQHNYMLPQIGASDLQLFDNLSGIQQRTMGNLSPFVKVPLELAMNRNTFTGQPISDPTHHPRVPIGSIGAAVLSLLPGSNVGQTMRQGPGGKELKGPGANPYYAYLLGQIPWMRSLAITGPGSIKRTQKGIPGGYELSQGLGLSLQHVDPALEKEFASLANSQKASAEMAALRDSGIVPRAKHKKSNKQDLIDQILFKHLAKK